MIISRTPFRISFFGGGSDYPSWYNLNGGQVLSTTINKYCFINIRYLPKFFNYKYRIRYYRTEEVNRTSEIKHPAVREALKYFNISDGIELVHNADLPARSGLGSSSTFTVGLINTLLSLKQKKLDKKQIAEIAIELEQNVIKESVGSQDQIAASYGGLNNIVFSDRDFQVKKILLPKNKLNRLEDNLMLFFTGFQRSASKIASKQISYIEKNKIDLFKSSELVSQGIHALKKNKFDDFGMLLDEQWKLKKNYTNLITNSAINKIYNSAKNAGAIGGKLLGAGGGGFMLFYVKKNSQSRVRQALRNLLHVPFKFEKDGSKIVYASKQFL